MVGLVNLHESKEMEKYATAQLRIVELAATVYIVDKVKRSNEVQIVDSLHNA